MKLVGILREHSTFNLCSEYLVIGHIRPFAIRDMNWMAP